MKRSIILPALISIGVYAIPFVAGWYYWDSGWYTGVHQTTRTGISLDLTSILQAFFIIGIVVWLKFFVYETIARRISPPSSRRIFANVCFYGVYALAVANDVVAVFLSSQPVVDAGFAAIAIIFYSPVILAAGLIALSIMSTSSKTR